MTLGEKLLALRTERKLSQGDVAEQLEVSRQSVSKWETDQSVPDLDKIIKLADLFGVTVDQLVREGERPQPPEPKVVYVEREEPKRQAPLRTLGVVIEAIGAGLLILGLMGAPVLLFISALLVALGLPLLLVKKHPLLIDGWLLVLFSYLIFSPFTTGMPPGLLGGLWGLYLSIRSGWGYPWYYIFCVLAILRGTLILALLYFSAKAWKERKRLQKDR